jgi:hypothetical protein
MAEKIATISGRMHGSAHDNESHHINSQALCLQVVLVTNTRESEMLDYLVKNTFTDTTGSE